MTDIPTILVVTATREKTVEDFKKNTLLGKSLEIKTYFNIELKCFIDNTFGLGYCYNQAIQESKNQNKIIVFVHDDVALLDYYWPIRVNEALQRYDIVGVAGNERHENNFPSWAHSHSDGINCIWDEDKFLSGSMLHGNVWPPNIVTVYGSLDKKVVNLDGVFIATTTNTLRDKNLEFDPIFDFHFYDADFCKSAIEKNCNIGTFPLSLLHAGKGTMTTDSYIKSYLKFNEKWSKK